MDVSDFYDFSSTWDGVEVYNDEEGEDWEDVDDDASISSR